MLFESILVYEALHKPINSFDLQNVLRKYTFLIHIFKIYILEENWYPSG